MATKGCAEVLHQLWGRSMRPAWKSVLLIAFFSLVGLASARAADAPPPVPPPPPPQAPTTYAPVIAVFNWTGFYIGGNLGWGWSQGTFNGPAGAVISTTNTSSFLGGGQVGFNYQFGGGFVTGLEADFDSLVNSNNTTNTTPGGFNVTSNERWFTLVDARLGYAWDRWLVYGKGGFAWVGSGNSCVNGAGVAVCSANNSNYGWNVGAGVEWAFWNNLSARLEYDYVGINGTTIGVAAGAIPGCAAGCSFTGSGRSLQMINLGLNYRFGY
jgi:outer membrane immunogenic protein